ncbi:MAG: hypothetical protein ACFFB3_07260 [Candidatus Hodarchaeota archaeon]
MKHTPSNLLRRLTIAILVLSLLSYRLVGGQGTFKSGMGTATYVFHGHCNLFVQSLIQDFYGVELEAEWDGGGWNPIEFGINSEGTPFLEVKDQRITNETVLGLIFEGKVTSWNDYWIPLIKPPEENFSSFLMRYEEKWENLTEVESVKSFFYDGLHRMWISGHSAQVPLWRVYINWESVADDTVGYLSTFNWQNRTGLPVRSLFSVSVNEGPWPTEEPLQDFLFSLKALMLLAGISFAFCLVAVVPLVGVSLAIRRRERLFSIFSLRRLEK